MEKRQWSRVIRTMLEARDVGDHKWMKTANLGSPGSFSSFRALMTVVTDESVLLCGPENTFENASFRCFLTGVL